MRGWGVGEGQEQELKSYKHASPAGQTSKKEGDGLCRPVTVGLVVPFTTAVVRVPLSRLASFQASTLVKTPYDSGGLPGGAAAS